MNITYDNLPQAVAGLYQRFDDLEKKLLKGSEEEPVEEDELLVINQAAILVKKSVATIYTLVHRGEIPCFKRGGRLYFSKLELIAWIKQGRKSTNHEIKDQAAAYVDKEPRIRLR